MDGDKIGRGAKGRDRRTARMETRDGRGRRRCWSASDKSQINVSEVARRHGVHANILFRRRRETLNAHYDALRARFPGAGADVRQVVSDEDNFLIRKVLIESNGRETRGAQIARIGRDDARLTFNLEKGPLTRFILVRDDTPASTIVATTHHMIADGWSLSIIERELRWECARQAGLTAAGNPEAPSVGYRDYSAWRRDLERSGALEASRRYWRTELAAAPMISPTPASALTTGHFTGASIRLALDHETRTGLDRLTRAGTANSATIVMSAFFRALRHELHTDDILIGTPLAGRDRSDLRNGVGMFINNVPIRLREGNLSSPKDFVPAVRTKLLHAVAHQHWQLDRMAEDCNWSGDPAIDFPFTNIFFSDMTGPKAESFPGDQPTITALPVDVRYHMMLYSIRCPDGHVLDLRFRASLYPERSALSLLAAVVDGTREIVAAQS